MTRHDSFAFVNQATVSADVQHFSSDVLHYSRSINSGTLENLFVGENLAKTAMNLKYKTLDFSRKQHF